MTTAITQKTFHTLVPMPAPPRKFEILEQIGEGGTSTIYKAKGQDGKIVALKYYNPDYYMDFTQCEKEARLEFEIGQKLNHPHIIKIFDFFLDENNIPVLVLEFVDGETVENFTYGEKMHEFVYEDNDGDVYGDEMHEFDSFTDPRLKLQLLDILIHIHKQGFIHSDLFPMNFMVEKGGSRLKMIDLASLASVEDLRIERVDLSGMKLQGYFGHMSIFLDLDASYIDTLQDKELCNDNDKDIDEVFRVLNEELPKLYEKIAASEFEEVRAEVLAWK